MAWTRIKPHGQDDETTYWISGIYKIVSYRSGEYLAYFIRDGEKNWGDHPSSPPDHGEYGKVWKTLASAQATCMEHAPNHEPTPSTVRRAAELLAVFQAKEETVAA